MDAKAAILIRIPKALKEKIEISAKAKGYKTVNRYIADLLKNEVEKKGKLPEIFYKPARATKYKKWTREEIYEEILR